VRALVEERCGSPVVDAESQGAGFTPGFASVLTCADGSQHFVKAASQQAQRLFAESYREEARKLGALPDDAPAPRLLWVHDDAGPEGWIVLGIEHVAAHAPQRPWCPDDLAACVGMTERMAATLTPVPAELDVDDFATEFAEWPSYWDHVSREHADRAAALAARFPEVTAGTTLVHTDIRDDNLLLTEDGRVLLCDWNWPVAGAPWLDTLFLLIGPRGDGLDVDAVLAGSPLTRDLDPDAVDIVLALITGYFLRSADLPVPPTSPHMREAQRWQGEVCWEWLCERRGWS
jgi:aminoglycoside phosphotransferase (APT) family kinase protein